MSKFKAGDRARLVAVRYARPGLERYWFVGAEVVVVKIESGTHVGSSDQYEYLVQTPYHADKNQCAGVMGWQLEPITGPYLGSWEEIARLTKWQPEGVMA